MESETILLKMGAEVDLMMETWCLILSKIYLLFCDWSKYLSIRT